MRKNTRILTLVFVVAFLTLLVGCQTTPSNQMPILTSDPVTTATVGTEYIYDVDATDPNGDTLTYSFIDRPEGMVINSTTGVINWIPSLGQIGDNPVVVKVSDGSLSIAQSFIIKVSESPGVNQAPIIYSIPITTATVGLLYTYDVNATDPDGDTLTYSLTAKPSGMAINPTNGLIWWVPTSAQSGNNLVTVNVSDRALSDTQSFIIKVSEPSVPPVNQAPIIYSDPVTVATVGIGYVYDVNAFDPEGDVLTYSLITKPGGMTISPSTGKITWTPTTTGSYGVTVNAFDGKLSGSQRFTIVVSKPPVVNHTPTITSDPFTTAILGVKYIYDVNATDPDGDVLTYSILTTKPDNMTIDSSTGVISWMPNAKGDYAIVVEVSDGVLSDTQSFTIKVSTAEITGIVVLPEEMILSIGESKTIESVTATYEIKTGFEASIALGECNYDSSDVGVAIVSDVGEVTAIAEGPSIITVNHAGKSDTIVVTVFIRSLPVHNIDTNEYYDTIQAAIDDGLTKDGDTIEVAPGMYSEGEIHINKSLMIQGAGRSSTTIYAAGADRGFYIEADDVTIKDLTVKNAPDRSIVFWGVIVSNATIDNVALLDSGYAGLAVHQSTVTNLVINNSLFSGNANHGMRIDTGGVVDGMTITNSHFDGNEFAGALFYGSVTNVLIEDSTFNNNLKQGIYVESLSNATFTNVTANNNSLAGCDINLKGGAAYENLVFNDCTFMDNGTTDNRAGLIIKGVSLSLNSVDINGGTFSGNEIGISVGNNVTNVEIHNANIFGNYHTGWKINAGVINWTSPSATIDATYNWWGDASGPLYTTNPFGKGDAVSDNVDYEHWLSSPH